MANQVTFQIKIETTGEENVKNITMDAEELGKVVKEVTDEQEKLNTKLLDINQAQQAIQNVVSGISQIASEVRSYTTVYAMQETAEAKVVQVMRNTMNASDAEIASIKELCAAQQELGVIGDEVQLSGAQELATYLEKKSSLERLIPVMNDMLAQQYGLEASQESAATIATMLGKVMEGQTQALSRYGYSFDEAQEKILKYGTEEERAAVLAEVVSQSVGGMNEALRQTPSGQLKAAENTLGDIKEQIGALLMPLEGMMTKLNMVGQTVGSLNNLTNGIRGVNNALGLLDKTQKLWNATSMMATTRIRALTTAMNGGAAGATTLGIAIRGLMIATGVGIAIAALTTIIAKLMNTSDDAADSLDKLTKAQQSLEDAHNAGERAAEQARIAIENEKEELAELIDTNGDASTTIDKLNQKYGETFGYHKTAAEWYDILTKKSEDYCEQLMLQAEAQAIAAQMVENSTQMRANFREQERLRKEGKDKDQSFSLSEALGFDVWRGDSEAMKKVKNQAKELREEGKALREEWERTKSSLKGVGTNLASGITAPSGTTTRPSAGAGGKGSGSSASDKEKAPAAEGSINRFKERLAELRQQIEETGDADLATNLQTQYEALEKEFKEHKIGIGLEKPEPEESKTYMETLQEQLAAAQKNFDNATTVEARVKAIAEVSEIQAKINEATRGKVTIEAVAETSYVTLGSDDDKRQSAQNAQANVIKIQQDFEIGLIGKEDAEKGVEDINKQLKELGLKPIDVKFKTDGMRQVEEKMKGACDSINAMGSSLSGLGDAIGVPELNIAGTMAQAIATMVTGYATATSQAASMGPWAWIAFAALGLAQLTAMITSVKDVAKFADGGVAYGPTLGLFGEYANAATNPEVVAPLDKLRSILSVEDGTGGKLDIRLRARGRDLVGVSNKRNRLIRRS